MQRFHVLTLMAMLALALLCNARTARGEEFELQYVSDDKFLEIYADHPVDKKAVADRVGKSPCLPHRVGRLHGTIWEGITPSANAPADDGEDS